MLQAPKGVKPKYIMKVAHLADITKVIMDKCETLESSERVIAQSQAEVRQLGKALTHAQKSMRSQPNKSVSTLLHQLRKKYSQTATKLSQAAKHVKGTHKDKSIIGTLKANVMNFKKGVTKFQHMQESDVKLGELLGRHTVLKSQVRKIVSHSQNVDDPAMAISVEKIRKAEFASAQEIGQTLLQGDARDSLQLRSIQDYLTQEQKLLNVHKGHARHQTAATKIKSALQALQHKLHKADLADSQMSKQLHLLKLRNQPKQKSPLLGESDNTKTVSQLAADVDKILSDARQAEIDKSKKRIKDQIIAHQLRKQLRVLGQTQQDANLDSQFLDTSMLSLKKAVKTLHSHAKANESPAELANDVETLLSTSTKAPPLDVAEELLPLQDDVLLSTQEGERARVKVPFVSNQEAKRAFNANKTHFE